MTDQQTYVALNPAGKILGSILADDDDAARCGIKELLDSPLHRDDLAKWADNGFYVADYGQLFLKTPAPKMPSANCQTWLCQ